MKKRVKTNLTVVEASNNSADIFGPNTLWSPGCWFGRKAGNMLRKRLRILWLKEFNHFTCKRLSAYKSPYFPDGRQWFQVYPLWWLRKIEHLPYIVESFNTSENETDIFLWKQYTIWRSIDYAVGLLDDDSEAVLSNGTYWHVENVKEAYKENCFRPYSVK